MKNLKVVTWNCNGALRKKYQFLDQFDADVYVIQECENPLECIQSDYTNWAKNHLWIGDSKNKGLGVFAKENIKLEVLDWPNVYNDHSVKHFLPCLINGNTQFIAVWAHSNNSPTFGYIGQFWKYLQLHKSKFNEIIIAGDFNSNSRWDRWWNHSDVIRELKEINIESFYHLYFYERSGKEQQPTFFLQRNLQKPYHIDYVFGSSFFKNKLNKVEIGKIEEWLLLSDHLPMFCEFTD
ncbi:endonuclease/exonuclease/phosphatase family protein [Algoriphagus sp. NG3]|uniref:endonuclease/exonuclease/phosphatase family protein n=1 Tax=Algoriphagus sp. NG3 TaxID=3097546 RepID=UPI002A7FBE8C|nr:endonuclease/exonuclease/phosphatase family protein [Algoriphagus sp. NG3]WPR73873.1 endonuclease/exonuclease/phosphatase family protein [Algoriphagus sp. NG3]